MMPSTARPVVTVEETLTLSNGKSPVRINQRPSKSIPRFLPAKLLVRAIYHRFAESSEHKPRFRPIHLRRKRPSDHRGKNGLVLLQILFRETDTVSHRQRAVRSINRRKFSDRKR